MTFAFLLQAYSLLQPPFESAFHSVLIIDVDRNKKRTKKYGKRSYLFSLVSYWLSKMYCIILKTAIQDNKLSNKVLLLLNFKLNNSQETLV